MIVEYISDPDAIITESTSGICLGITKLLTAKGMGVMLNGLGDADEIEGIRKGLKGEYGVKVHSGADMSEPTAIRSTIPETAEARGITEKKLVCDLMLAAQPT